MKVKVTKKEIKNNYNNIISIGYCELSHLLRAKDPIFYISGIYGWNADIYQINNNTCIVTGYSPFGNITVERKIMKKYEEKAEKICRDYSLSWEKQTKKLEKLLKNFINEILTESED